MQLSDPTPDGSSADSVVTEDVVIEDAVNAPQFDADPALLAAVDLARAALLEITPANTVGAVVGHTVHDEHVLSLHFASLMPGYPDWHWAATLSRIDADSEPNVLETELLPGEGAVLAPEWTPWSDRLEDYKLAQDHAAALADDEDDDDREDDDESDDDDSVDDDLDDGLDLDDHIIDDDILDDAVHEQGEAAVLDASILVRADDEPVEGSVHAESHADDSAEIDADAEGLTVVTLDDSEPRASVYYDEDAPRDDE